MSEPPPILAYASRVEMVPLDAPRQMSLRFERPSAGAELGTRLLGCFFAAAGIGIIILLAIAKSTRGERWDQSAILNNLAGVLVMACLGWWCMHGVRRLRRFGKTPIIIELADEKIVIDDPVQFGEQRKILSLSKLRDCTWSRDALVSFPPVPIRRIHFLDRRFEVGVEVRVATADAVLVERAVADLRDAIRFHRGLPPR